MRDEESIWSFRQLHEISAPSSECITLALNSASAFDTPGGNAKASSSASKITVHRLRPTPNTMWSTNCFLF
jgi:hypothetical protein